MSEISRVALFGKLNSVAYKAIESATVFCKLRGNPYVELAHWIAQIVQTDNTDIHCIVRHFEIDASRLSADVTAALDKLPRGATAISDLSEHVMDISERARRSQRRHGPGPDGQAGGPEALHHRPHRSGTQAARWTPLSAATRKSASHRHPDAPPPEQPDPGR
jgi:ATP-dependent Clp protease ATP-binding subunit ClpA